MENESWHSRDTADVAPNSSSNSSSAPCRLAGRENTALLGRDNPQSQGTLAQLFLTLDFPDREEKENSLSAGKLALFVLKSPVAQGCLWCYPPQDTKHFTSKARVPFFLSVLRVVPHPRLSPGS